MLDERRLTTKDARLAAIHPVAVKTTVVCYTGSLLHLGSINLGVLAVTRLFDYVVRDGNRLGIHSDIHLTSNING